MSRHHQQIRNDPRWKAARAEALDRDGYACVVCGETEGLEADHVLELSTHPELAFEPQNLVTYCRPHHVEAGRRKNGAAAELPRARWIAPQWRDLLASSL